MKYHPDKVSEEEREESEIKFKEISFAYEVLIDETKREEYDRYGSTDGFGGGPDFEFTGNPFDQFLAAMDMQNMVEMIFTIFPQHEWRWTTSSPPATTTKSK